MTIDNHVVNSLVCVSLHTDVLFPYAPVLESVLGVLL